MYVNFKIVNRCNMTARGKNKNKGLKKEYNNSINEWEGE